MTNSQDVQAVVHPGDVLAGKYRVERVLGAGGMGVVVAAHHLQLDQKVALKFLLPEALKNAEAVGRFVREARAAVKITGEHVARVSDVGQLENGSPYIVMEYLEGLDLSMWLKQRGVLPIELAVDFVLQTCEAIASAHALGIVHRDLKPANLFCVQRQDGQLSIKVLDFGISKVMTPGASGHDMTRTSALVGSPFYMSPEQMQSSKTVDARTDIWSLGVILHELLAGQPPFTAEAVTELAIKIAMAPAPPMRAFRTDVPPGLEHIVATCLEKDRERRYPTVGELAGALGNFGSSQSRVSVERVLGTLRQAGMMGAAVPLPPGALQGTPSQHPGALLVPSTGASWGKSSSTTKPGSGRAAMAVGAAAVLVVLATGGALMVRRQLAVTTPPVPSAVVSTVAAVPVSASALTPEPTASPTQTTTMSAAATSASASLAPRASTAVQAPRTVPPAPRPVVAPSPSVPPAPPKSNCDPPYYFDAQGARIFKKECL